MTLSSNGVFLLLFLVVWIFHVRSLRYDYIIDDQLVPQRRGRNPIQTFLYQLTCNGYSDRVMEHLQRIFIHYFVCCLMYLVFGMNEVGLLAALFFAVHPVNMNGVTWLNGVGYSMSALLVMMMLASKNIFIISGLYALTLFFHVTALPACALFVLIGQPFLSICIYPYVILVAMSHGKVPWCKYQKDATLENRWTTVAGPCKQIFASKLVFVVKTYAYYFFLCLRPLKLGLYHTFGYEFGVVPNETQKWTMKTPLFWFGLALLAGNAFLIFSYWGTPLSFGLAWFTIFIAPFCNWVVIHQPISERYCYLPNIGLMYALSWLLFQLPDHDRTLILSCLILGGYMLKHWQFLPAYRNMQSYIEYSLVEFPDCHALWSWRGTLEWDKGRIFSAMTYFTIGLRFLPTSFRLNHNLAKCFQVFKLQEEHDKYMDAASRGLTPELVTKATQEMIDEERTMRRRMGIIKGMKKEA